MDLIYGMDCRRVIEISMKSIKSTLKKHIHYFDDFCGIDSDWANFEESLGSFNQDSFHDNAAMQPSLEELGDEPKRLYGYEDEIAIKKRRTC